MHVYLRLPPGVFVKNSVSKLAPNCDVRGNAAGGYVLGEGSTIHRVPYEALSKLEDQVDMPPELIEQLETGPMEGSRKKDRRLCPN